MIYLDYSANTPADAAVIGRFCEIEQAYIGNPNSAHAAGRAANEKMAEITNSIAELLSVLPEEIIYTSGASEANNLAIKGTAHASRHVGKHIISTPLEHSSVSGCLTALQERGYEIDLVDIMRDGTVDVEHLEELMRRDTVLVTVCAVDSELGTIQPIREIAEIVAKYPDCRLHVDATQAMGKLPFCFDGIDMLSFAPHKFYGLNGSGVLVKRKGLVIEPQINGGASTTIYRSGTPALALAAAAETALRIAEDGREENYERVQQLNDRLRKTFSEFKKVRINSPENTLPHILNISVDGVRGTEFQKALDEQGVCVSVKSACSVANTPSRAVYAVSRDRRNALSSWRISLSHKTTDEEIEQFIAAFTYCYKELTK